MNKLKKFNVTACEYVAEGSHGKHSLINVYTGDILIQDMPGAIKLSFYLELLFQNAGKSHLRVEAFFGKKMVFGMEANIELEANKPAVIATPQFAFQIEEANKLRIFATIDEGRKTTILEKNISQGNIITLTPIA